jgi:DNA-directed RNA polymerase specialized sigma24 family protein
MSNDDHAWLRYAELQQRSRNVSYFGFSGYVWGIECALNYLLNVIEAGTVPPDPPDLEAALNRAIASGARLHRSRSLALKTWVLPPDSMSTNASVEAKIELARIGCAVKEADEKILLDAGLGYTDREIANRHASTPGAIRVRLSRLRLKLAAKGHSVARQASGRKTAHSISELHGPDPQPRIQAS